MQRANRQDQMDTPIVDDGSSRLLLEVARTTWTNSALLIVLSMVCLLVFAPFVVVASLMGWLVVWGPMVLATAPFWLVTIVTGDRLLDGRGVALRELPGMWRNPAAMAWKIALASAASGIATLGFLELTHHNSGSRGSQFGLFVALGVSIAVAVLIGPTLAAAGRYDLGMGDAWTLGARWLVAAPIPQLGLICCYGVLVWLAIMIGPVFLLGVGPLGLLTAAISRGPARARQMPAARSTPSRA